MSQHKWGYMNTLKPENGQKIEKNEENHNFFIKKSENPDQFWAKFR